MAETSWSVVSGIFDPDDAIAWVRFAQRYQPLIARWCRQTGLQEATADDICQDVLLKLFKRIKTYDPRKGSFRGWLKQIVRNAICDYQAKAKRLKLRAHSDSWLQELADSLDGSKEFDSCAGEVQKSVYTDLQEVMARVQNRVEPETWETFRLRVLEELTTAEVAARLGIPIARVYVYRGRILNMLRKEWGKLETANQIEERS